MYSSFDVECITSCQTLLNVAELRIYTKANDSLNMLYMYDKTIGVARILSAGVHFFTTQQKLLKLTLALAGGCT